MLSKLIQANLKIDYWDCFTYICNVVNDKNLENSRQSPTWNSTENYQPSRYTFLMNKFETFKRFKYRTSTKSRQKKTVFWFISVPILPYQNEKHDNVLTCQLFSTLDCKKCSLNFSGSQQFSCCLKIQTVLVLMIFTMTKLLTFTNKNFVVLK
jgi:hypothetical protein